MSCRQVGYDDPAFFRRLFKRTTGLTPRVYRRKLQAPPWYNDIFRSNTSPAP